MAILGDFHATRSNLVAPMANFLLERGANVNSPPSEKYTSTLQAAIDNRNYQFIDPLLDAGADVNANDPRFGTALTTAAAGGKIDLLKKLLERGADPHLSGEKFGLVELLFSLTFGDQTLLKIAFCCKQWTVAG
jgi:ankyrin repeat protein